MFCVRLPRKRHPAGRVAWPQEAERDWKLSELRLSHLEHPAVKSAIAAIVAEALKARA
jgi:hypothetical protein